jgi:hypothetical protein
VLPFSGSAMTAHLLNDEKRHFLEQKIDDDGKRRLAERGLNGERLSMVAQDCVSWGLSDGTRGARGWPGGAVPRLVEALPSCMRRANPETRRPLGSPLRFGTGRQVLGVLLVAAVGPSFALVRQPSSPQTPIAVI